MANNENSRVAAGWRENILKSGLKFGIDKAVAALGGVAATVLLSILVPLTQLVFRQFYPIETLLGRYWLFCMAIVLVTIPTWIYMFRKSSALALAVHATIAAAAFLVSGLMREGLGLPDIVRVQFLLYFAGVILACEIVIAGFVALVRPLWRAPRTRGGEAHL